MSHGTELSEISLLGRIQDFARGKVVKATVISTKMHCGMYIVPFFPLS